MTITSIMSAILIGLALGAFGRIAEPSAPIWLTIGTGIVASFIGILIARGLGIPAVTSGIGWLEFLVQAVTATAGVSLVAGGYQRAIAQNSESPTATPSPPVRGQQSSPQSTTHPPSSGGPLAPGRPEVSTGEFRIGGASRILQGHEGRLPAGWYALQGKNEYHQWDGRQWTGASWTNSRAIFLSYAREDAETVSVIVNDLRAARLEVWFDEDVETGQAWWDEILSRIRGAAVFVHSVSDSSLRSTACAAERGYAEALSVPILPVLVRDAELRSSRYGETQLVDYRIPDRERAARLISDVMRMMPLRTPMLGALPEPPPPPFYYLLQFAEELQSAERIDEEDQRRLLHQIIDRRAEVRDAAARIQPDNLLRRLISRSDTLYSVAVIAHRELGQTDPP